MSLDISTLYLIAMLVAALLGAMLLFFARKEEIAALAWWGAAYVLGAIAIASWTFASAWLGEWSLVAFGAIGLVACGMMWNAARIFHGRKSSWPGILIGAAAWIAAVATYGIAVPAIRINLGAGLVALYAALTAAELLTDRRKAWRRRWPAVVIPAMHGFALILPILVGDMLLDERGAIGRLWITVFAVELVLYAVGSVLVIFMLASERAVTTHKAAASIDPLTGLFNRRGFSEATARMIAREAAAGRPVTVMILDIDHFKLINDRFGHAAGDEVLKVFASVVSSALRITDLTGRIGGEEFAAMLPCSIEDAVLAAERVREAFATCGAAIDDAPIETTVSIGVAGGPCGTELEVLLAAADTALYQAKRSGRNRVEAATEEPLSIERARRAVSGRGAAQPAPSVVFRTRQAQT